MKLTQSEERYRAILAASVQNEFKVMFEAMTDCVCIYDAVGNIVHANAALRELLGISTNSASTSEAQQAYDPLMFPGDEQGQLLPHEQWPVARILRGETLKESGTDIMICLADGREVILNVSGAPMRDAQGQIVGAITVLRNVTGRRWLEMQRHEVLNSLLAMAETLVEFPSIAEDQPVEAQQSTPVTPHRVGQRLLELARNVLGCLRIGMISVDLETGTTHPMAVVGLSPEYERQWWLELQSSTLYDYLDSSLLTRLYTGEEVVLDLTKESFPKRSTYGVRAILLVPMQVRHGLVGVLGIEQGNKQHAYTEEEQALIKAIARMAALVIERERLLHEYTQAQASELALREINQRMNDFLSIASHELRTPLAVIKGNVQLAQKRLQRFTRQVEAHPGELSRQGASFQDLLEVINGHTRLLDRLVGDLLDASRTNVSQLTMRALPCDLASIVRAAVEELRLIAPTRSLRLEIVPEGIVPIIGDSDRIKQVVANYLNNARKYSETDRPIMVNLRVEGARARVSVRDQGPGLAEEELKRVWERFYRTRGTKAQSGLGLGLYICNMIVQWHEGQVGVESAPGKGSTFWFTLPLAITNQSRECHSQRSEESLCDKRDSSLR